MFNNINVYVFEAAIVVTHASSGDHIHIPSESDILGCSNGSPFPSNA